METRRIKPLTGQVFLEILRGKSMSRGGILFPQRILSPEEVQYRNRAPEVPMAVECVVRAVGPWPKTKNGMLQMPEFGIGDRVFIRPYSGVQMRRNIGEKYQMVKQKDVIAVLT